MVTNPSLPTSSPDVTDIQKELMKDVKASLGNLGPALIQAKMDQQQALAESAAQGGPVNSNQAIVNILDYVGIGARHLARELNLPRKKVQAMLEGRMSISPEIISGIYQAIEKKKPGEIDRLRKLV